jgi:hypothetical protein
MTPTHHYSVLTVCLCVCVCVCVCVCSLLFVKIFSSPLSLSPASPSSSRLSSFDPARLRLHGHLSSTEWGSPSALALSQFDAARAGESGTGVIMPGG